MKPIQKKIQEMLKENTGEHFLDSGGAYGRHWQENQQKDFRKERPVSIEVSDGEILVSRSLFHYLAERLDITEESEMLDKRLQRYLKKSEDGDFCAMQCFAEDVLEKKLGATGLYGEGKPAFDNSYNGECSLNQTIQFGYFEINENPYIILQIHGGCDVRGGYTTPRIFAIKDDGATFFLWNDVRIRTTAGNEYYTDDGYHWYADSGNHKPEIKVVEGEPKENPKFILVDGRKEEIAEVV